MIKNIQVYTGIVLGIMILLSPVYADTAPKVVKSYLGVYEYNGTYYDPLDNTFDGNSSYSGSSSNYDYAVIVYELDNGQTIRQIVTLTDNLGSSDPVSTVVTSWTDPDGNEHDIFERDGTNTNNVTALPYIAEIPVGSQINVAMNDNCGDDNYADGEWKLNITKNGITFENATQFGGFWHNTSFKLTDIDTNNTWNITMPYKDGTRDYYSGIIPLNGSNATIYNISGGTSDAGANLTYSPINPDGSPFFKPTPSPTKTPTPISALILSVISITYLLYKRNN
jgi:hypothetical protein